MADHYTPSTPRRHGHAPRRVWQQRFSFFMKARTWTTKLQVHRAASRPLLHTHLPSLDPPPYKQRSEENIQWKHRVT
ncbi:hypothetical protein EJB05_28559 [Eragrostis curvula]|uniref:Uncharacterized protein n=1 Tax=Eragrostis curvula TaxID=38414 RepID=A0A5J9UQG9_9POAL|nr:hypothetical protein EJB05_28559 [Eragrostis curvula]